MVGWALFREEEVRITGRPTLYRSSENATRYFCGTCGTGLFYTNPVVFPGAIDIQTGTLDDQQSFPPEAHIQMADAAPWIDQFAGMPRFDRYPEH